MARFGLFGARAYHANPARNLREYLIEIGEAGGMWPRHKLDPAAVKNLLGAALLWPRGRSAVALTARWIQVLANTAKRVVRDA